MTSGDATHERIHFFIQQQNYTNTCQKFAAKCFFFISSYFFFQLFLFFCNLNTGFFFFLSCGGCIIGGAVVDGFI